MSPHLYGSEAYNMYKLDPAINNIPVKTSATAGILGHATHIIKQGLLKDNTKSQLNLFNYFSLSQKYHQMSNLQSLIETLYKKKNNSFWTWRFQTLLVQTHSECLHNCYRV